MGCGNEALNAEMENGMTSDSSVTYGDPHAGIVLLQIGEAGEKEMLHAEWEEIQRRVDRQVRLILFPVSDWNRELSPWPAPPVFGKEAFFGYARQTLDRILEEVLPPMTGKEVYIGGYSLAGLFSLWAAYETDAFKGVNAASPSVWYPDWLTYIDKRRIQAEKVYLSLGDREEKTKNPVLSKVGACIRAQQERLLQDGVSSVLEWNQGNHFQDAAKRTVKGFVNLLNR